MDSGANIKKRGRPRKKDYDKERLYKKLLETVDDCFDHTGEIKATSLELGISSIKVKKLLITSGKLIYAETEQIQKLLDSGMKMDEIQKKMGLKKSSINSYLPYSKIPYKEEEVSANADRCELYRRRKAAVGQIFSKESLWECVALFSGYTFHTALGAEFRYEVSMDEKGKLKNGIVLVQGKECKALSRTTITDAYEKVQDVKGSFRGEKSFGKQIFPDMQGEIETATSKKNSENTRDLLLVSYLYSMFSRFGVIKVPERIKMRMNGVRVKENCHDSKSQGSYKMV